MKLTDKNQDYFGLDIGTTSVRVVQLKPGDSQPELVTYNEKAVSPAVNGESDKKSMKTLSKAVKEAVDEADITTKSVVAAISNRDAFTVVTTTPKLNPDDLAEHIRSSATQYLPQNLESPRLDWYVLNPDNGNEQMDVLLVAAEGAAVDRQVEVVKKAGLNLSAVEVNALAVSRSVIGDDDNLSVVVDIGSNKTEVTVVWRRVPYLIASVDVGGDTFTELVKQGFNVDEDQANKFLRDFGLMESKLEGGVLKVISGDLDKILDSVSGSIDKFKQQYGEVNFGKVVLTGVPVSLPGLPSYIANQLQLPAQIANPWMNVTYPAAEHDRLMSLSLRFSVAVGLAQKELL